MWYRVNDPLSPLSGCDVMGDEVPGLAGVFRAILVTAVRRVDVFAGDRPYQRVAAGGGHLGLMLDMAQLVPSPIQDDVVEIATDRPYGAVVEERDHDRSDGLRLRVVEYELLAQLALDDTATNSVLTSATVSLEASAQIEEAFIEGNELDEVQFMMVNEAI